MGLSRQLLECLHGIPEQGIQEKPGKSHAVTSATFYRSPRPAVIYRGRRLHKGMGLGSGDHWWPSCRPTTTVCLLPPPPTPPPAAMIQGPPTYKIQSSLSRTLKVSSSYMFRFFVMAVVFSQVSKSTLGKVYINDKLPRNLKA